MKNPELLGGGVGRTNDNNLLEIIIIFGALWCLDRMVVPLNFVPLNFVALFL